MSASWLGGHRPVPLRMTFKLGTASVGKTAMWERRSFGGFCFLFFLKPRAKLFSSTTLGSVPFPTKWSYLQTTFCLGYSNTAGSAGTFGLQSRSLSGTLRSFIFASFSHPANIPLKMETHSFHLSPACLTFHITGDLWK